jgi:outer membrane murein-binding lipoprotein Lpp
MKEGKGMRAYHAAVAGVLTVLALSGCDNKAKQENVALRTQVAQMQTIGAEKDSLLKMVVDNTQLMNDINNELNKVKDLRTGVVPVSSAESGAMDTVRVQDYLLGKVKEVTDRINAAETQLAASQRRVRNLSRAGDTLKAQVTAFQNTINQFQAIIDTQKVAILAMTDQINQLQTDNVKLVAQKDELTGQVDTLTTERNTVFYTIGNKHDLVDRGIAVEEGSKFLFFGGKSLQPARQLDNNGFTMGDMRNLTVLTLPDSTRKYKIISRQNLAGLGTPPSDKGEFRSSIQISNPELFWGPSKYLIVVEQ